MRQLPLLAVRLRHEVHASCCREELRSTMGNARLLAAFKDWVRDQIARQWQPTTP